MEPSRDPIKTRRTDATWTEEVSFMYHQQSKTICNMHVLNYFGGDYTCQEQLRKAQDLEGTGVHLVHVSERGLCEREVKYIRDLFTRVGPFCLMVVTQFYGLDRPYERLF